MEFEPFLIGAAIGGFIELCRWIEGPPEPIVPNEYGPGWQADNTLAMANVREALKIINRRPPPPQGSGESDVDYAARLFAAKVAAEGGRTPFYGLRNLTGSAGRA